MILGYGISGRDNDSYLFPEGWGKTVCEVLDYIENRENYLNTNFKVKRANLNLSYTYDSALIVSQKFRDFCLRNDYKGLEFHPLKKQTNLYLFKTKNIIEFDSKRRGTQFEEYQEDCKMYNSIAGATPIYLKSEKIISDGIYRTDIRFGGGYEQSPFIIIGVETFKKMKLEKMKDIDFIKILTEYK